MRLFVLAEIHRLAGEGRSYKQIAKILGTAYITLRRWRDRDSSIETAYHEGVLRVPLGSMRWIDGPLNRKEEQLLDGIRGIEEMGRSLDLTGVRQQGGGKLTARRVVGKDDRRYNLWECDCDCGGETVVSSARFLEPYKRDGKSGKGVYSCDDCKNPSKVKAAERMHEANKAKADELGDEWSIPGFAEDWQKLLEYMNDEQELLFETIVDGRYSRDTDLWDDYEEDGDEYQVQMEALDIVLNCYDIWSELATFGTDRVARARKRLARSKEV